MVHIDTYIMEYNSAIRKNEVILFAAKWMKLEIVVISEINQKDKYNMVHHYMESKIWHKYAYIQNRNRQR